MFEGVDTTGAMTETTDLLFVYGTLLGQSNSAMASFLKENSQIVENGFFPGELYDLGDYPGAVFIAHAPTKVYGTILKLTDWENTLAKLDEYEETGPGFVQPNEYLRKIIQVENLSGRFLNCWVYEYNYSTKNKTLIASGKYLKKGNEFA